MKELIAAISAVAILAFLPVAAFALYSGGTVSYVINDCQKIMVNITNAQMSEWNVYPNCTEQSAGNFYCTCSGDWTLHLQPAINSQGNFAISIVNYNTIETTTQTLLISSGGGGAIFVPTNSTTTVTIPQPSGATATTATQPPGGAGQTPTATSTSILPATAAAITGFFSIPTVQYGTLGILGFIVMLLLAWFVLKSRRQSLNTNDKNETPAAENPGSDAGQTQPQTQGENQNSPEINQ